MGHPGCLFLPRGHLGAQALFFLFELRSEFGAAILGLECLTNLDLGFRCMRIGAALYPFDSLFQRPHLPQPESGDKFLGLGEGSVDDGTLGSGKLNTFALRGRM